MLRREAKLIALSKKTSFPHLFAYHIQVCFIMQTKWLLLWLPTLYKIHFQMTRQTTSIKWKRIPPTPLQVICIPQRANILIDQDGSLC